LSPASEAVWRPDPRFKGAVVHRGFLSPTGPNSQAALDALLELFGFPGCGVEDLNWRLEWYGGDPTGSGGDVICDADGVTDVRHYCSSELMNLFLTDDEEPEDVRCSTWCPGDGELLVAIEPILPLTVAEVIR